MVVISPSRRTVADALDNTTGALITAANPATAGEILQLYANGLGPVTNPQSSGDAASASRWNSRLVGLLAAGVVLGFGLTAVPIVTPQDNLRIAVLAGVPTLAGAWVLARKLRTSNLMAGWGGG